MMVKKVMMLAVGFLLAAQVIVSAAEKGTETAVPTSAEETTPLRAGALVPELTLRTGDGKAFSLAEAMRKKPTVLIFYRGGWCPYCNVHLSQLQEAEADLVKLGYQVLAISPDRPEALAKSVERGNLTYTLLSDADIAAAKAFGIAFQANEKRVLPVPAVFIIGTDGKVKFSYANADYKTRLSSEELLAAARAASQ